MTPRSTFKLTRISDSHTANSSPWRNVVWYDNLYC